MGPLSPPNKNPFRSSTGEFHLFEQKNRYVCSFQAFKKQEEGRPLKTPRVPNSSHISSPLFFFALLRERQCWSLGSFAQRLSIELREGGGGDFRWRWLRSPGLQHLNLFQVIGRHAFHQRHLSSQEPPKTAGVPVGCLLKIPKLPYGKTIKNIQQNTCFMDLWGGYKALGR